MIKADEQGTEVQRMGLRYVLLAIGALVLLAGCGKPEVPDVLLNDPIVRPEIVHATEVRHIETGGSGPFIQSSPSRVITTYELAPEDLEAAAADVLTQAEEAGWELSPAGAKVQDTELARVWSGTKILDSGGGLRLLIGFRDTKIVPGGSDPEFGTITVDLSG